MNILDVHGIRIFRPTIEREQEFHSRAANHLRSKYPVGTYTERKKIGDILGSVLEFYEQQLDSALRLVLSQRFVQFILFQYDQYRRVHELAKAGNLSDQELLTWKQVAPVYGRAIKFIMERSVLIGTQADAQFDEEPFTQAADEILICAEAVISMSILSDQTYHLFPHSTELQVTAAENPIFLNLRISDPAMREKANSFGDRLRLDNTRKPLTGGVMTLQTDPRMMDVHIGTAIREAYGLSFEEITNLFLVIREHIKPAENDFPTFFLEKGQLLLWLKEAYTQLSLTQLETILQAFLVNEERILSVDGGRSYWNPKAEYRAFRRGLFEIKQVDASHAVCWSTSMFGDCLQLLIQSVSYGDLPAEWNHAGVLSAVGRLTVATGKWFEHFCRDELIALGWSVVASREKIGKGLEFMSLVPNPGEIDLFAYNEQQRILLVAECKRTRPGVEAKFFRNDISKFTEGDDAYIKAFERKIEFVRNNITSVCAALSHQNELNKPINPTKLVTAIITTQPSFASLFINNFPCVSIKELIAHNSGNEWPYKIGEYSI